jgi:formamidopyrimidine-DNA glycosylase
VPELVEVEAYRRRADAALGRPITGVEIPDPRFVRGDRSPAAVRRVLLGSTFGEARRIGKLLLLDLDLDGREAPAGTSVRLGVRFGMTGRLLVDGAGPIEQLLYSSERGERRWDRFVLGFADGGSLVVHDPRLLGGVELDPDVGRLGPDALALTPAQLRRALAGSAAPLKARLLDQARIAGVGNLIADEVLWRAGLRPARPAGSLGPAELRRLHRHLGAALADLMVRGGSHLGDLMPARHVGGACPRDGTALTRSVVGGRTSYWCRRHQR